MNSPRRTLGPLLSWVPNHTKLLAVLGTLLGLFILFNYILMPLYVKAGSTVQVPSVVGATQDEAEKTLAAAGLQPIAAETRPVPDEAAGTIINQNPAAGATVKEGRRVYLTISGGELMVSVPSLRGRSVRDARFALERVGLRLGGMSSVPSADIPQDAIVNQTIAGNTRVARGTAVGIEVSLGPDTAKIPVPVLTGKSIADAEQLLVRAGLRVGNVTLQPNFDLLPNTVVDQFPRGGEMVPRGQAVDLFVVKSDRPAEEIHNNGQ